ncbi:MAG: hypothetical protein AAFZ05_06920 [Pseudomonadota bacterium]
MIGRNTALIAGALVVIGGIGAAAMFMGSHSGSHSGGEHASGHGAGQAQPYAGQQARQVASLSVNDIQQLEKGAGWGFAKPAELNGYPGPLHVLELADKLELTGEQKSQTQAIFDQMNKAAREIGARFIAAERAVDGVFKSGPATPDQLAAMVKSAAETKAELRLVHLNAHIKQTRILTAAQRTRYAELRGYGAGGHGNHSGHSSSH